MAAVRVSGLQQTNLWWELYFVLATKRPFSEGNGAICVQNLDHTSSEIQANWVWHLMKAHNFSHARMSVCCHDLPYWATIALPKKWATQILCTVRCVMTFLCCDEVLASHVLSVPSSTRNMLSTAVLMTQLCLVRSLPCRLGTCIRQMHDEFLRMTMRAWKNQHKSPAPMR